ncbi:MAG: hypothetical protein AAB688_00260 [Patescibacteria group bacterium]
MKLKNFIFVGVFLAGLFSGTSAVLATENGTECDAVAIENVLEQARGIAASAAFLQELKPEIDDTKKVVEELVAEQNRESAENSRRQEEAFAEGEKEYEAALNRYWGRNSRPNPKND